MELSLFKAYLKVWLKLTSTQFSSQVANARGAALLFLFGKVFRLATAFLLIYVVVDKAKLIAGYNLQEAIFILLLFNLTSTITQLFLRGVYMFRQKVVDGTFDFYLINPLNELFYSLFSFTDPLDVITVIPFTFLTFFAWSTTGHPITLLNIVLLFLIIFLSFLMAVAWHIIIISIGVRYLEVDNTIMLYRDLEKMAAFPIDIYGKFGSTFLTYAAPFALMATIPAKIFFGLFNPLNLVVFAILAFIFLKFSLYIWRSALLHYSSASS